MISLIVAMDNQQVIGFENRLPWHYKEDLAYFKKVTTGHDLLMGRHTFESILSYNQKPLANRFHYVLTATTTYSYESVATISKWEPLIEEYPKQKELFVIGGQSVYEQLLPVADRLYITHINQSYKGDAYFPFINWSEWRCIEERITGELKFAIYERVT